MATTTNYSWTTPDDTALVKDGAAAIRSLGTAIDTTVFNNASAAIAKTIVDAKGDIIAATAADTVSRLAVGANDTVLTADSSTATGLKWAALASGSTFAGCRLYKSAGQTIATDTNTALTFDSESYDTNTFHDNSTNNSRITIPSGKAGYYLFICKMSIQENPTGYRQIDLRKNNSSVDRTSIRGTSSGQNFVILSTIQYGAVSDYFEFFVFQTSNENMGVAEGTLQTVFTTSYLGA